MWVILSLICCHFKLTGASITSHSSKVLNNWKLSVEESIFRSSSSINRLISQSETWRLLSLHRSFSVRTSSHLKKRPKRFLRHWLSLLAAAFNDFLLHRICHILLLHSILLHSSHKESENGRMSRDSEQKLVPVSLIIQHQLRCFCQWSCSGRWLQNWLINNPVTLFAVRHSSTPKHRRSSVIQTLSPDSTGHRAEPSVSRY